VENFTAPTRTLGREPTPEEIAERLELSVDKVKSILKAAQEPIGLSHPIGEDDARTSPSCCRGERSGFDSPLLA